jgi:hypothetical protein
MPKKIFVGGAGGRKGYGGGGFGVAPGVVNVGTGTGQVYKDTTGTINLRTLKQGTGINIVTAGNEVTIGAAAFSDVFWQVPVISIFDNTLALPVGPSVGDRYISLVTANGWTKDNIYDYNGATWDQTIVIEGMATVVKQCAAAFLVIERVYIYGSNGIANDWAPVLSTRAGEIITLPTKPVPTISDWLLIEDLNDAARKKYITIGSLPAAAPAAHAIGGGLHSADTIPNIQSKVSGGSLITSAAGEITALTEKTAPVGLDEFLIESIADANAKRKVPFSTFGFPRYIFYPENMDSPNNADAGGYPMAPASVDSLNNALIVRAFDDTAIEGAGFKIRVPLNALSINFMFVGRPQTAPGAPVLLSLNFRRRIIRDNTVVGVWGSVGWPTQSILANTNFQYFSVTIPLATLSALPDDIIQFVLIRLSTDPNDTLVGDWNLLNIKVSFT